MTKEQETPVVREEPAVRGALCDASYGADWVLLPAMRTRAWGYADLVNERANTAETRFATASAGKAFIAASIMHLIEAGKLDLYPLFADRPAVPDTEGTFRYNNSGYVLLGRILESVTGEVFDQWLGRNLFLPAGMTRTGYYELDRLPQGCAYSYIEDGEGGWYTNIYSVDVKDTGAGGAFTTVTDIARFWEFLLRGTFLSAATVSQM
ncbi:serine hydrolase domain-containing protein [Jonesia quinghaiensis]|uniref:serine hydrolase domain-containing protein n=1 Tax=Jonesia quinghaiensis TaxID=262806 RepID=UPI0003F7D6B3|nr:serine hydrolase domain-containing protein [Jonesia quinghaiensis]